MSVEVTLCVAAVACFGAAALLDRRAPAVATACAFAGAVAFVVLFTLLIGRNS